MSSSVIRQVAGAVLLACALLPAARLLWQARDMPHLGAAHDDQYYWITAESLAQGTGYRTLSGPGNPYHTYYPPLYPALLSLVWIIDPAFPHNLELAALANWCFLPLFVMTVYDYLRRTGLGWLAWPGAALMAVSPIVVISSQRLMTELLFGSILLVTLTTLERAAEARGIGLTMIAGLLASAAYLTRTAGLVLIFAGALALSVIYRRHLRAVVFAAVSAPSVVAWSWWAHLHSSPGFEQSTATFSSYSDVFFAGLDWKSHLAAALKNAVALTTTSPRMLLFIAPDWLCWGLDIAIVAGVVALFRGGTSRTYAVFAAAYVAALIVWTFPPDERLMLPLLPLIVASLMNLTCTTARQIAKPPGSRSRTAVAASLAYVGIASYAVLFASVADYVFLGRVLPRFNDQEHKERARDRLAEDWILANTARDAGIVSDRPVALYLDTGRRGGSPDLPTPDWYKSPDYRTEDWLLSIPVYLRAHALRYVLIRDRDWTGLSLDRRAAIEHSWFRTGLVQRASPSEGSSIYELIGNR